MRYGITRSGHRSHCIPDRSQRAGVIESSRLGSAFPTFETWDRICKLYGWSQTFVADVEARRNQPPG